MLRVGEGKTEEAWQDILACHRLGRLVGQGGSLIELLVGIALDAIADNADVAFLNHAKLTPKQINMCLHDLQQLPPMPALVDKLDSFERFMCLDSLLVIAIQWPSYDDPTGIGGRSKPAGRWDKLFTRSIDWDPALRDVNQAYNRCRDAARMTDRA